MKKQFIPLLFLVLIGLAGQAQDKSEIAMIRDMWKVEKKDLVREYMALDEKQAAGFWPLYDSYSQERASLATNRMESLENYAKNYTTLTDEQSDNLVKAILKNDKENVDLQEKYYKKMKKVIGSTKAAQFLQMESYFQTQIRAEVQEAIPFIGQIERKKG